MLVINPISISKTTQKHIAMKVMIATLIIGLLFNQSLVQASSTTSVILDDESYIDDIPFNTLTIYKSYRTSVALLSSGKELQEEAYIDDIPFNTAAISDSKSLVKKDSTVFLTDEQYVDDIPFNTAMIASEYAASNSDQPMFSALSPEPEAEDIPFSTSDVVESIQNESYANNESGIVDPTDFEHLRKEMSTLINSILDSNAALELTIPGGMIMSVSPLKHEGQAQIHSNGRIQLHLNLSEEIAKEISIEMMNDTTLRESAKELVPVVKVHVTD